jgi:hypothetical protein
VIGPGAIRAGGLLRRRSPGHIAHRLDDALFIAVGLSFGSGLIHVQAAFWHLHEYLPFAIAFAVLAAAQFAWGAAVYRRPAPWLLGAGALVSSAVAGVWLASRTSGLPIGPEPWQPEPMGAADLIATANEVVLCLLVLVPLWGHRGRSLPRAAQLAASGLGVALLSVSSLTFMFSGGH